MKLRLSILLLAAALAAAPAAGQTIKSLGFNTSNGVVPTTALSNLVLSFTNLGGISSVSFSSGNVLMSSNTVTFYGTNSGLAFSAGANASQIRNQIQLGATWLTNTNVTNFRTDIGLGATNNVTFSNITANGIVNAKNATLGTATNAATAQGIQWSGLGGAQHAAIYGAYDGVAEIALSVGTTSNALSDVATFQSTGMTVASNAVVGGTLTATGNATLNGVNNTMPNATNAASGSSLMTRDFVGQEFANPRNRIQTTYWFGLEGLGYWTTVGTNAVTRQSGMGAGLAGGIYIYASTRIGSNIAGAGLRSFNDVDFGGSPYAFSDGGPLTMRARVRKNSVVDRPAFAFLMGSRTATQMWQQDAYGIYFVPQPTNSWVSNAVVTQHSRIAVSNVVWAVNTAGTNGATEPTWTDLIGSLVTNGSAVYVNAGPHTSNNWVLAIGSTNASGVIMTNTGKVGPTSSARAEVVLKLRTLGTTNTPYTVYGSVENSAGESTEVSLTTTNNDSRAPQFWSRTDETTGAFADMQIRYISIDSQFPALQ
jgi:hypothetical protein